METMISTHNLKAELRRHNLLIPLLERQIVAEAVGNEQLSPDDLETARQQFLESNGLKDAEALEAFLAKHGFSEEDFNWQVALPLRIKVHCFNQFRHKAEAQFLVRKNHLDRVVYSLLRTKDLGIAKELYLRIDGGEANFGDLASQFSEGPERNTKGIIGPVPITQAHPILAEKLRTTKPGLLLHPQKLGDWWAVIRLESYTPAIFDDSMAQMLSRELFDNWIKQEVTRRMMNPIKPGVAPTAE